VAHPCGVQECGFSDPRFSLSPWPIPIGSFFARDVFRMEEKPAPFTRTVKGAAPENSTHSQTWPTRFLGAIGPKWLKDLTRKIASGRAVIRAESPT